jgi:MFS family permease
VGTSARAARDPTALIRTYFAIVGLYTASASLTWGINTLYLLHAGYTLLEIFVANAVFTGAMAAFEIPTGVVADVRGRRRSFLWSVAILMLGTVAYVAVAEYGLGFWALSAVSVFLGLGFTFYSGAVEAWLVDGLDALGYEGPVDSVLARGASVSAFAMFIGVAGGAALAMPWFALPYVVRSVMLLILFVLAIWGMHDIGFSPDLSSARSLPREMKRLAKESIEFGWGDRRLRLLIVAAAIQAVLVAWGFHAWQPHFLALLETEAVWVAGLIAGLVACSTMVGNAIVTRASAICGRRSTLLIASAAVFSMAMVGVGLATSFWVAMPLYLLSMGAMGVFSPVRQAYLHGQTNSANRATVLSFASLVSSGGSMAGQGGLGWVTRNRSLADGYFFGGIVTALAIPVLGALRAAGGYVDQIGGSKDVPAACAARGLASVGGLTEVSSVARRKSKSAG